jgi:4-amino-4-deoxy-L-arabinose transferase-like glycosyltransferase
MTRFRPPSPPAEHRNPPALGWMLAGLALWLLATAWLRPLLLPDEGRYAEVAREMLTGDVLLPTLYGLPYFHKPPLMYWIDVAAMRAIGVGELAARAAPLLGGWLMGAALYLDRRHRSGPREAAIALGVLATAPFFFIGAQYANHDLLVAALISVAVLLARRAVDDGAGPARRWVVGAWAAMALAVLAKGLIGVVLPALVVGPWLLAQRRWRDLARLLDPLAILVFAAIAVPWFVAMQARYPAFLDYFFVEQHFRRFAQTGFNNAQPFWFFVPVLPLLVLPWSLWLPAALRRPPAFEVWWIVAVVGFFSLPESKLVGYVMPALVPLCTLLGAAAARGRRWRWAMALAAALCLGVVGVLAWKAPDSHRDVGRALAARWQAGDGVALVGDAFFDVPYYAGLTSVPVVLSDWDDPAIPRSDNWRKELADAARIDPPRGARALWPTARAGALPCGVGALWLVAKPKWVPPPALQPLERVLHGRHADLWRRAGPPPADCR